jgi:hypothetical protein
MTKVIPKNFQGPTVLVLIFCIISCLSSTSSNYIDLLPILLFVFYNNPLYILIVLVSLFLYLYKKCQTVFCLMVFYAKIHTCRKWLWTISSIVFGFLTVVKNYRSSTSSKASSSTTSSSEASFFSLIISTRCIILRSLIVLWTFIIVRWCYCTLFHVVILWW